VISAVGAGGEDGDAADASGSSSIRGARWMG